MDTVVEQLYRSIGWLGYQICTLLALPGFMLFCGYKLLQNKSFCEQLSQRFGRVKQNRAGSKQSRLVFIAEGVGELQAVYPLVQKVAQQENVEVVIALQAVDAMQWAKKQTISAQLVYLPYDLLPIAKQWVAALQPTAVVIMERALWPNLYLAISRLGLPMHLISARMSPNSARFYRVMGSFFSAVLNLLDHVYVQDQLAYETYQGLGVDAKKLSIGGNLKYAITAVTNEQYQAMRCLRTAWVGEEQDQVCVLQGVSTHFPEEAMLCQLAKSLTRQGDKPVKLIIVPRDISRAEEIRAEVIKQGLQVRLESDGGLTPQTEVLVVDAIGRMKHYLAWADIAFVGGSIIAHGGQNPLEPILMRTAVITGPHTFNFRTQWQEIASHGGDLRADGVEKLAELVQVHLGTHAQRVAHAAKLAKVLDGRAQILQDYYKVCMQMVSAEAGKKALGLA